MISTELEESIKSLIPLFPDCKIIKKLNVGKKLVHDLRAMTKLHDSVPKKKRVEIAELLLLKVPVGAIELRTGVHRQKILAIKRYYYLQFRKISEECKCPTCGKTDLSYFKEIAEKLNGEKTT